MAHIFEMCACCNTDEDTQRFIRHFDGMSYTAITGLEITCVAGLAIHENPPYVSVVSMQLGRYGRACEQDIIERDELDIRLFHRLLTAPDFRFALTGEDPDPGLCVEKLDTGERVVTSFAPYVMSRECWLDLGSPTNDFRQFRPGYLTSFPDREWSEFLDQYGNEQLRRIYQELPPA